MGRDGVSNHLRLDGLVNLLFRRRSKKTSKLRVNGLCEENSPMTGEFPIQRASNAENASIWWRHHGEISKNNISNSIPCAAQTDLPAGVQLIGARYRPDPPLASLCLACCVQIMTSSNENIFRVYWPFVRGIHRSPLDSPHKGQWRGTLMPSLICAWTNGWANTRYVGDLRRHGAHYDVIALSGYLLLKLAVDTYHPPEWHLQMPRVYDRLWVLLGM